MGRNLGRLRRVLVVATSIPIAASAGAAIEVTLVASNTVHCTAGVEGCSVDALCPAGLYAYGGGIVGDQVKTESSYPISTADTSGWRVSFRGAFYEYGSAAHAIVTAYVLCAALPGGYTYTLSPTTSCADGGAGTCVTGAQCPSGWTLLSGGIDANESQLEHNDSQGDNGWVVTWFADLGDFGANTASTARAYAVCGHTQPPGFTAVVIDATTCDHDGPSCSNTATCPAGTVLTGGGFYGNESKVESMGPINSTTWLASWYPATEEYGSSAQGLGAPTAFCAVGHPRDRIFLAGFE